MTLRPTILWLFLLTLLHSASAACTGRYVYEITFDFDWSFDTDIGFPNREPNANTGFSNVVCASHSSNYTMWRPGQVLSKQMIEFVGPKKNPRQLLNQLRAFEENKTVHEFDDTQDGANSLGEKTVRIPVTPTHTLISCASRIVPSPSWFVGISSLDMCRNNTFLTAHDLVILGWWGGLDDTEDYTESEPLPPNLEPLKVRRRIDFAPYGYGTLFIARRSAANKPIPSDPANQGASPNTNGPRIVPAAEAICVDANTLHHLPRDALLYPTHRHAYVLCDPFNSCATPGHIVVFQGRPMMMKSYCQLESNCERRVMLVNSPKYSRAMRIDTSTHNLKFTAFAARFSTRTEEGVLSLAVRMGL